MKNIKYLKFTNDIRLEVLKLQSIDKKKEYLLNFLKDTNDMQYSLLRVKISTIKTDYELIQIMFNMQLKSEGLGI